MAWWTTEMLYKLYTFKELDSLIVNHLTTL